MNPGIELDALVASKVMGWRREEHLGLKRMVWKRPPDFDTSWQDEAPHYSTEIADAWEVVEKLATQMGARYSIVSVSYDQVIGWFCRLAEQPGPCVPFVYEMGNTAQHAICLAALKTVGEKV